MSGSLLEVSQLSISFDTLRGRLVAVDRIGFSVAQGETLGIVGESGCGKSITSLALMRLLPPNAKVEAKRLSFEGKNLLQLSDRQYRPMRGSDIAMIFQDPMTSLNPSFTVGFQLKEVLRVHKGGTRKERQKAAIELLDRVGIPEAEARLENYPHQLSGGMAQRVMIAIAIACRPKLLIADEPTTALDVTIQAQILSLLKELQKSYGMALILITHDLGIVAQMARRTLVMYAGQVVESGPTEQVIRRPTHPYTEGLLRCLPGLTSNADHRLRLPSIQGLVPDLVHRPSGCQLNPRCPYVDEECRKEEPADRVVGAQTVKCIRPLGQVTAKEPV
jgi:dipeptide transport system ATP-binding protein